MRIRPSAPWPRGSRSSPCRRALAPALISAVAKEEHVHTGAEQVRALMGLLGAPGDASSSAPSSGSAGPPPSPWRNRWRARGRRTFRGTCRCCSRRAASPTCRNWAPRSRRRAAASHACQGHRRRPCSRRRTTTSGRRSSNRCSIAGRRMPPAALLAGLTAAEESQRVTMLWHVFTLSGEGAPLPEDVIAAAAPRPIARGRRRRGPHLGSVRARAVRAAARHGRDQGGLGGPAGAPRAQGAPDRALPFLAYAWLTDAEAGRDRYRRRQTRRSGQGAKRRAPGAAEGEDRTSRRRSPCGRSRCSRRACWPT